jgi:hypothetical protein
MRKFGRVLALINHCATGTHHSLATTAESVVLHGKSLWEVEVPSCRNLGMCHT